MYKISEAKPLPSRCLFIKSTVELWALSFQKVCQTLAIHANLGWAWPSDNAKPNREISVVFWYLNQLNRRRYVILLRYSLLWTEANIYKAFPKSHLFGDTFLRRLLSNRLPPSCIPLKRIKEYTGWHISVGWWQSHYAVFIRRGYVRMTMMWWWPRVGFFSWRISNTLSS